MNKKKSKFSKNISQNFFLNVIFTSSNHPATQTKTIFCLKIEKNPSKTSNKKSHPPKRAPSNFSSHQKSVPFFFRFFYNTQQTNNKVIPSK